MRIIRLKKLMSNHKKAYINDDVVGTNTLTSAECSVGNQKLNQTAT